MIQHRSIKVEYPWINGMIEDFNSTMHQRVFRTQMPIFAMVDAVLVLGDSPNREKRPRSPMYSSPAQ